MNLTNSQYDALKRVYEDRQFAEARALKGRREALYARFPMLQRYQDALTENAASRARARIMKDQDLLIELDQQADRLKHAREDYILEQGVDISVLEPHYICADCQDTGYVNGAKCHCFLRQEIDLLYQQSHLTAALENENFSKIDYSLYDDAPDKTGQSQLEVMTAVIDRCREFAASFDEKHGNILFYGRSGLGKTFLTNCIAKELLDSCHSVVYFSAVSLFEHFSSQSASWEDDLPQQEDPLYTCDLLIIDDLGTETPNAFTLGKFFSLINDRLLRSASTLISTNLSLNQLADRYTERTASRIFGSYERIHLDGQDLRLAKKLREIRK